jgi:AraC-like DNA-binding protein
LHYFPFFHIARASALELFGQAMYILVMHRYAGKLPLSGPAYRGAEATPLGRITYAGRHLDVTPERPMGLRRWDTYSLVYVKSGRAVFHSQAASSRAVGAGDLILMFPRHAYRYAIAPQTPWSEIFVQFDGPAFDLWLKGGLLSPHVPVWHLDPVAVWWGRLEAVVAPACNPGDDTALHRVGLLQAFLADAWTAAHRPGLGPADRDWLAAARSLLGRDLAAYPDWVDLSRQLGLSHERFRKRFRELAGSSPAKFRAARRIEWAAALLESDARTVENIARTCGYHDKFHFMKRFKAATGLTPAQHRLRGH